MVLIYLLIKKDKYFLIEVMMNTYSKCLKNTKVTSYCSYISVDETMIYTGVRTGYRIHIPSKPAGQGIVFYCAGDSEQRYLYYLLFYRGKVEKSTSNVGGKLLLTILNEIDYVVNPKIHQNQTQQNTIQQNVIQQTTARQNSTIFVDCFFCNISTAYELKEKRGINIVGCVSKNRKDNTKAITDFLIFQNGNYQIFNINGSQINIVKILDKKKQLIMITTYDRMNTIIEIIRKKYDGENWFQKDLTIIQKIYTLYMHGIDIFDYCISLTTCRRRNSRWTYIVFEHLIDVSGLNVYTAVNSFLKSKSDRRIFLKELGKSLCEGSENARVINKENNKKQMLELNSIDLDEIQMKFMTGELKPPGRFRCEICKALKCTYDARIERFCCSCRKWYCKSQISVNGSCWNCSFTYEKQLEYQKVLEDSKKDKKKKEK